MTDDTNTSSAPVDENQQGVQSEAQTTQAETDTAEQNTGEVQPEESKPKRRGFQKRIDELTRRNYELQRELERLRAAAGGEKREAPSNDERPDPSKYNSLEEYLDALSDWKVRQHLKQLHEQEARRRAETEASIRMAELTARFDEAADRVRERIKDFDEVVFGADYPVTPPMFEAIMASEIGPEIAYYLGTHPREAARIARLDPINVAREIGKLEAKIAAQSSNPSKPGKPSSAPPPIKPLDGASSSGDDAPSDQDDIETWMRKERERLRKLGRLP